MRIAKILKPGTTTGRKAFWDAVADIVGESEKVAGKNVSVDVRDGYGSVINARRERGGGVGACCVDGECSITTETDCAGNFLGIGTTCDDVDCTQGACCQDDGDCTNQTEAECSLPGEVYLGDGTSCERDRCEGACIPCQSCPSDCFCVDGVTYQECYDAYFNACRAIAFFGNETCMDHDCSVWSQSCAPGTGTCCNEFGDIGCSDGVTEEDCFAFSGTSWHEGCTCGDLTCWDGCEIPEGAGACCFEGSCFIAYEEGCTGIGGTYQGNGVPCDPDPC